MEHLLFKATATAVDADQGTFEAVISTASIDREGDIVDPQAVVDALHKWVPLSKMVPLSWGHSLAAEDIIGHIDPGTAEAVGDEVRVKGWVDQSIDRGREAWRLVKSGTLGFSYGYLTLKSAARRPKGRHISELDIFEITATPAPMNGDTRVLSFKSVQEDALALQARILELDETSRLQLQETMKAVLGIKPEQDAGAGKEPTARSVTPPVDTALKMALDVLTEGSTPPKVVTKETPKQGPEFTPDELRKQSRDLMLQVLTGTEVT